MGTHKPQTPEDERIIDQIKDQADLPDETESPDEQAEGPKRDMGRRKALQRMGILGAGLLATILGTGPAEAQEDAQRAPTYLPAGAEIPPNIEMAPEEVDRMQYAQEIVYKHYLSPPFIIYLRQLGVFDKVKGALEPVMRYPYELWYKEMAPGVIKIKKRPNSKVPDADLPNNLSIIIKSGVAVPGEEGIYPRGKGFITEVNGDDIMRGKSNPQWQNAREFERRYDDYVGNFLTPIIEARDRVIERYNNNEITEANYANEMKTSIKEALHKYMNPTYLEILFVSHFLLAHQYYTCLGLRNEGGQKIDPTLDSSTTEGAAFQKFVQMIPSQGDDLEEMKDNLLDKWEIEVNYDPTNPDVIIFDMGQDIKMGVSAEGYFLQQDAGSTTWRIHQAYEATNKPDTLKEGYYRLHPKSKK